MHAAMYGRSMVVAGHGQWLVGPTDTVASKSYPSRFSQDTLWGRDAWIPRGFREHAWLECNSCLAKIQTYQNM